MFKRSLLYFVIVGILSGCGGKKEGNTQMSIASGKSWQRFTTSDIEGDWEVKVVLEGGRAKLGELKIDKEGKFISGSNILVPQTGKVEVTGALELANSTTGLFRGKMLTSDGLTTLISVKLDSTRSVMRGSFQNKAAPGGGKVYLTRVSSGVHLSRGRGQEIE